MEAAVGIGFGVTVVFSCYSFVQTNKKVFILNFFRAYDVKNPKIRVTVKENPL